MPISTITSILQVTFCHIFFMRQSFFFMRVKESCKCLYLSFLAYMVNKFFPYKIDSEPSP